MMTALQPTKTITLEDLQMEFLGARGDVLSTIKDTIEMKCTKRMEEAEQLQAGSGAAEYALCIRDEYAANGIPEGPAE